MTSFWVLMCLFLLYCGKYYFCCFFFFFQAEDGIRDYKVTGVQTCALPIWGVTRDCRARERGHRLRSRAAPLRTAGSPRAAAVLGRGDAERPQPAQVQGGAGEVPLVAHLRHAAEDEATKAHRLLALRVPTKDVPYARGPSSAAGRRGRRRSAYEAPRAAADRGTPLGGAESKRRRRPRLPAPPSRVTLLLAWPPTGYGHRPAPQACPAAPPRAGADARTAGAPRA